MTALPDTSRDAAAPKGVVVSFRDVSKIYGNGTQALRDMSLDVRAGEFVSLLGPSGCGKSTALRITAGLGAASSGTVIRPSLEGRGDIGFVFQDSTLMPWQTVFGNVYLPLRLRGVSRAAARDRVMEGLASVGLADFAGAYPRELSGGMKMRVSIARAMITKPKLLLLDEPFAALDEITRQKLNDELLALWQRSALTVMFVTHSVYESAYLSSRIVVMSQRPGTVFADLPIEANERGSGYRTSPAYVENCRLVSETLQRAIETTGDRS